jgi:hypothetical protein
VTNNALDQSNKEPFLTTLRKAAKPLLRPHTFLVSRPFLLVLALYGSTYATANSMDTLTNTIENKPAAAMSSRPHKFVVSSLVNMSMCIYKDAQFLRMFGSPTSKAIPTVSYALFALRDSMTIFASFNAPSMIAPKLNDLSPAVKERFSRVLATESKRLETAQFIAPAAMQLISTPIFLLGLDLHNRRGHLSFGDRLAKIRSEYVGKTLARMGRIVPAFGVGGVVNIRLRESLMRRMEK